MCRSLYRSLHSRSCSSIREGSITATENPKAEAWNGVGGMFWTHGRITARPSLTELEAFCSGVQHGHRVCVVGASTKELAEALIARRAEVTVLDFSARMCRDLADALDGADIRVVDITAPLAADLVGLYDFVLADRLINRFDAAEAKRGVGGMASLLNPSGEVRTSVKLGLYAMDELMLEHARRHGDPSLFWDESTQTIDFSRAGESLDAGVLPHGTIDLDLLKSWYVGRGREKRFSDAEVCELLAQAGLVDIAVSKFPDAPRTNFYIARRSV